MMTLFAITAGLFGLVAIVFIEERPRFAVVMMAVWLFGLAVVFDRFAGTPAMADGRLASEQWRVLSIAALPENHFLIAVRYASGALRAYDLDIADPIARDEFLKAQQALKKGRSLIGKAGRGRAGLINDANMDWQFHDLPDTNPKDPPQ